MLTCHIQLKMKNRIPCIDVQTIPEDKTFITCVYRKPTFSGIYTCFGIFYHLPISLVLFTDSLIDASEYALVGLTT